LEIQASVSVIKIGNAISHFRVTARVVESLTVLKAYVSKLLLAIVWPNYGASVTEIDTVLSRSYK
jgi:hypothetical protein